MVNSGSVDWPHITDQDLERYYLGMIRDDTELAPLEEHLLACEACLDRVEETQELVDFIRAGIILGNYNLD